MIESGLYEPGLISKLAPNALSPNYKPSKCKLDILAEQRLRESEESDRLLDLDELDKPLF